MNTDKISRILLFVFAVGVLLSPADEALAIKSSPNAPPLNVHPAPRPTQEWTDKSFYKWKSRDIVKRFVENGLEVEDAKPAYSISPIPPSESTLFLMPSVGKNVGGYVSSYNSADDLREMKKYYEGMDKDPEAPAWRVFKKDNILVLISGRASEEKAKQYEKVLSEMD
ncbi:MAG TPA: hypothetical protein ENG95_01255 [Nitrospirae bacterium]|nr:hypothetical protein BMS3Abin10_00307 [bacterium BMS3Abin10]GBE39466.1 hypothetical protein BMS3Bbin08_02089 [bacterium BMS3Bbin08]HDK81666.1 hypothetical protein [Nitrospirota bacterium]HDO25255.1 hypothetical protein [Nitrospirota bacterium]